jgi:hypothetical protein
MKNQIIKLQHVLEILEEDENKVALYLVYLSIVFLGYKIPEVSKYFKLPEIKVEAGLTVCGVKLKNNQEFMAKMHKAARIYNMDKNLKLVA